MGAKLRSRAVRPMKGSTIKEILANNPQIAASAEDATPQEAPKPQEPDIMTLSRHSEYDSLHPEEEIRRIVAFLCAARDRYESNRVLMEQYQQETVDLWHYAELHKDLGVVEGFSFYKRTRETCRKRRDCKNEMELLQPVVNFLADNPNILNILPQVQGECRKVKNMIDMREYTLRTDVMK